MDGYASTTFLRCLDSTPNAELKKQLTDAPFERGTMVLIA